MSPELKRKRPWWFGWIPAAVLLVVIAAAIVVTVLVGRSGLGGPVPQATEGQVNDLNWSVFTKEGLAYIDTSRQVRIDMSHQPVDASGLGLPDDGSITIGPKDNGDVQLDYSLIINGGGEGQGGDKFIVSELTIETQGGVISAVRAPLSEVLNFRQSLDKLEGKAELFGWDLSGVPGIFTMVEDATRAGEPYQFTLGPADRVGVPIAATASCDPSGYCVIEYEVSPAS